MNLYDILHNVFIKNISILFNDIKMSLHCKSYYNKRMYSLTCKSYFPTKSQINFSSYLHFKYTYLPSQDTVPDVYPFHFVKLRLDKEDN